MFHVKLYSRQLVVGGEQELRAANCLLATQMFHVKHDYSGIISSVLSPHRGNAVKLSEICNDPFRGKVSQVSRMR